MVRRSVACSEVKARPNPGPDTDYHLVRIGPPLSFCDDPGPSAVPLVTDEEVDILVEECFVDRVFAVCHGDNIAIFVRRVGALEFLVKILDEPSPHWHYWGGHSIDVKLRAQGVGILMINSCICHP